jgi:hypothetical protein
VRGGRSPGAWTASTMLPRSRIRLVQALCGQSASWVRRGEDSVGSVLGGGYRSVGIRGRRATRETVAPSEHRAASSDAYLVPLGIPLPCFLLRSALLDRVKSGRAGDRTSVYDRSAESRCLRERRGLRGCTCQFGTLLLGLRVPSYPAADTTGRSTLWPRPPIARPRDSVGAGRERPARR